MPSDGDESDNDQSLAFAESLFFKSKGKNKKPLASTPVLKRHEADVEKKNYQESVPLMWRKGHRKKARKRRAKPDHQE